MVARVFDGGGDVLIRDASRGRVGSPAARNRTCFGERGGAALCIALGCVVDDLDNHLLMVLERSSHERFKAPAFVGANVANISYGGYHVMIIPRPTAKTRAAVIFNTQSSALVIARTAGVA